jgi:hypothetical protein
MTLLSNSGWAGLYYSGWARQGSLAQAGLYLWQAGLSPLQAELLLPKVEIYSLRDTLFIRHRLHCSMPVLGRLWARTGISFTVICWSWDAP